ncbi:MAG: ATPase, T2SS/T4P/T4SS family [Gemmatimonadota bacterium]
MNRRRPLLGQLLLGAREITDSQLQEALVEQGGGATRLGEILVRRESAHEEAIARALANQTSLPFRPGPLPSSPELAELLPAELARSRGVVPVESNAREITVAVRDPLDPSVVDDVRFRSGRSVKVVVAPPGEVDRALVRLYGEPLGSLVDRLEPSEISPDSTSSSPLHMGNGVDAPPVVRVLHHLLSRAIQEGASDMHLEQAETGVRVRFRTDGVLREVTRLPAAAREPILSRVKVMAGLDISVKRRPQDGGLSFPMGGRHLPIRVSTLPVEGGEKAVLRILDPGRAPRNLEGLGFAHHDLERIRRLLSAQQGVILAAGPTGSGKSSTLFGALGELDGEHRNVVTLEDPIEYRVSGVNQVQMNPPAGLTFPAALRAVLRQDPDVIMVGEIRDRETAEIAMAAAVTGHLVLSTIHTTDAPGAILRLLHMGVPPFLVAGGLAGVIAQRLVRRSCTACRGADRGCSRCRGGFRGRTGVFQLLVMNDDLRDEVVRTVSAGELRRRAAAAGMGTLLEDARRKVAEGVTTPHEVARAVHGDLGAGLPCRHCGQSPPPAADGCPWCGALRNPRCRCGHSLRPGWRFCPSCIRRVEG